MPTRERNALSNQRVVLEVAIRAIRKNLEWLTR
jgi:hypothetical protein